MPLVLSLKGKIMISIYDWFGYNIPIKDRYKYIKAAGFDGVLLWWSSDFGRGEDYKEGAQLARNAGLTVENIHTPILQQDNLFMDNLDGESSFNCYMQCIRDCADYEIPTMVVHLPDNKYPVNALGLERIRQMAAMAEELNINIAMENLRNLQNVMVVLDTIHSPKVGFCYDCCHHANYSAEYDLLAKYGNCLMAIHLHDNGGMRGQHQLPFDGNIDWEVVMKKIAGTGYQGSIALEPMNWGYEDFGIEEFLKRAYKKAKRLKELQSE